MGKATGREGDEWGRRGNVASLVARSGNSIFSTLNFSTACNLPDHLELSIVYIVTLYKIRVFRLAVSDEGYWNSVSCLRPASSETRQSEIRRIYSIDSILSGKSRCRTTQEAGRQTKVRHVTSYQPDWAETSHWVDGQYRHIDGNFVRYPAFN